MSGNDLSFKPDNTAAVGAIAKAFFDEMSNKRQQGFQRELDRRNKLADEFEALSKDQSLDPADRQQALQHYRALRLLMPDQKTPKEYTPDEKLKKATGDPMGIPAMVPLLYKKVLKEGPKQPSQPPAPAAPTAPAAPAAPGQPKIGAGLSAGMDFSLPPIPGGEIKGPNAISPAPAVPSPGLAIAAMPEPPAQSASAPPGSMANTAPPVDQNLMLGDPTEQWVSKLRTPEQIAEEMARIKGLENQVTLPDGTKIDARASSIVRGQQTAAVQMRRLGLKEDGTPIPETELTPLERVKIGHIRAQEELWDAQIELANARAAGIPAQIEIALGRLRVAQQNANTAASRAQTDGALLGMMLGGGAQGLLGQVDMGVNNPIDSFAEQVLTNQISFESIPSKYRPVVSLKIAQRGGVVIPPKLQDKLMHFTEAREAVNTIYDAVESYQDARGVEKAWAGYKLNSTIDALTRTVGRALGEKGVFTDQDKVDFRKLLSPGIVVSLTDPARAAKWVKDVEGLMNRVEQKQLGGAYQRVYSRKSGELDTFKPGDTKNVIAEVGGEKKPQNAIAPMPEAAPMPPVEQRVAGKTTATINGRLMVWTGKGWKPK
jgi:hypothetical protein